ncbi:MAG: xylanase [Bacteroidales bacterium]|nr:xylanase [Bacteroidales bacterium]
MKKLLYIIPLLLAGCSENYTITAEINESESFQTIDGFGASDAWTIQFSDRWPATAVNQAAEWLFSNETFDDGTPKGAGLSIWRFNLGAGSAYQDAKAEINPMTRTECFLMPDGSWDFSRQSAQVNFMKKAQQLGVNTFVAFLNSPPVYFTQNGLATNTGRGGTFNLKNDCYDQFADFMAKSVKGLKDNYDINISYICPVNEPDGHWNWQGPKQEGTPATNAEVARITRCLDKALTNENLDTKILVNESSDYRAMVGVHQTESDRGFAIQTLFNKDSSSNVCGLKHVDNLIAGHGYWTNTPLNYLKTMRENLRDTLNKFSVKFWMTEQCIMSNDDEIGGGHGFDTTMRTALYVARCIHHDIVYAGAASWQWWRGIGEDYKDGLLEDFGEETWNSGKLSDSRLLWVMGNYSRFVKPGAKRIASKLSVDENPEGLMITSYKNTDDSVISVIINYSDKEELVKFPKKISAVYVTDDQPGNKLKCHKDVKTVAAVPAKSVVTVVY